MQLVYEHSSLVSNAAYARYTPLELFGRKLQEDID